MTRDEILAMEAGRELDVLVATEAMEWRWDDDWGCLVPPEQKAKPSEMWSDWMEEYDPDTRSYKEYKSPIKENYVSGIVYSGDSSKIVLPNYSTDIAAAWQVVQKLTAEGFGFSMGEEDGRLWRVDFYEDDRRKCWSDDSWGGPELAICCAALLAKMELS